MLIVALVLAVVGLAALVTAVITSNELIAWVCIAASAIGVLLLIVDALRSRSKNDEGDEVPAGEVGTEVIYDEEYPEEAPVAVDRADVADALVEEDPQSEPTGSDSAKS